MAADFSPSIPLSHSSEPNRAIGSFRLNAVPSCAVPFFSLRPTFEPRQHPQSFPRGASGASHRIARGRGCAMSWPVGVRDAICPLKARAAFPSAEEFGRIRRNLPGCHRPPISELPRQPMEGWQGSGSLGAARGLGWDVILSISSHHLNSLSNLAICPGSGPVGRLRRRRFPFFCLDQSATNVHFQVRAQSDMPKQPNLMADWFFRGRQVGCRPLAQILVDAAEGCMQYLA
jgi:hypothetical protein